MSRPLRIEYLGACYHVMNRGRRAENIFAGKEDYQKFVELLRESSEMWNVTIAAALTPLLLLYFFPLPGTK